MYKYSLASIIMLIDAKRKHKGSQATPISPKATYNMGVACNSQPKAEWLQYYQEEAV